MLRSRFLRRQAESCIRLSQTCSDQAAAEHLRLMAAEFFRRAIELENTRLHAPPDADPTHR